MENVRLLNSFLTVIPNTGDTPINYWVYALIGLSLVGLIVLAFFSKNNKK